ncbi:amidohydrolase family protein [Novosphingobium sp. 9]|uniref:amidohydrolase family protein n=1 Tax=Novosphingobium sp. 9 TaxID=2025349 RepID=UPI0021B6B537|nr:amidohydrolase family protein [Novosphingobium sp. 9]
MTAETTVLRAGRVLPAADAPVLGASEIAFGPDGRIAAIRPLDPGALSEEEAGRLVVPALTDAHDHGRGLRTLAYGPRDQSLEIWLPDLARQPRLDPWLNAVVALGRLARSGVGVVAHCHNTQDGRALLAEAEAVSRAARDVGIRVVFGWPFFDRNPMVYGELERLAALLPEHMRERVRHAETGMRDCATNMALIEQARAFEHAFFTLQYHPVAPQWARPETLAAIAQTSARENRRVHMHCLETEPQRRWAEAQHPAGLLAWLDELGLLNDRLTLAHAVWLDERDIALLAARGVTVSVNASSNLRLRSGMPQLRAMLEAGVRVAFGLDGMALDDDEDMLREGRLAWHLGARAQAPGYGTEPRAILQGLFEAGRCGTLGPDGGGRIEVGAPADMLVLDFGALANDSVLPEPDVVALLLGRARKEHVRALWVGGRRVVAEGHCTGIDLPALEARLTAEAKAAYTAAPPDESAIAAMRDAIAQVYACGCSG